MHNTNEIIRTAIFTVKPDNIATFLGQRITYNCKKEVGTNYNQRILGTRFKHHMSDVSIKMYDKFGCVLRIESTCSDIGTFRIKRKVEHRDGSSSEKKATLKKMYDKFSCLRIEMTINDPKEFKVYKDVRHRDGTTLKRWVPMGKSISNLYRYPEVSKAANSRFL